MKINNFRGDLSDISAKTATLLVRLGEQATYIHILRGLFSRKGNKARKTQEHEQTSSGEASMKKAIRR